MVFKLFDLMCLQTLTLLAVGTVITLLIGENAWGVIIAYWIVNSIRCAAQAFKDLKEFER